MTDAAPQRPPVSFPYFVIALLASPDSGVGEQALPAHSQSAKADGDIAALADGCLCSINLFSAASHYNVP